MEEWLDNNCYPLIRLISAQYRKEHGIIAGESRVYGGAEVDFKAQVFEPKESIRARMYFYMQQKYGLSLSSLQLELLNNWDKCDQVDDWEKERNLAIEAIQGDSNLFVSNYVANASSCNNESSSSSEEMGSFNGGTSEETGSSNSTSSGSCDSSKKYCYHMDS